MPGSGLTGRVFLGLVVAVLPPVLFVVAATLLSQSVLPSAEPALVAILVVMGVVAWAGALATIYARVLGGDLRSIVELAQRGGSPGAMTPNEALHSVASVLAERDRQVAALAHDAAAAPVDDPAGVVRSLVETLRSVLRDPTWRAAVVRSDEPTLLPAGVYGDVDEPSREADAGDAIQWLAISAPESPDVIHGPWGDFLAARMDLEGGVKIVLFAPHEGRPAPAPADLALVDLVARHFGTATGHALLLARGRQQARDLERLTRVQSDFLRGVTHDLQTPLTSIELTARELMADLAGDERARSDLDSIAHQSDRLRRLVSQLLVASRLEAGVLAPGSDVFAVPPIVERTWGALRAARPFDLEVVGAPHLAVGDPDRFEQVLWALLDNAVKYSPPSSPIRVRVAANEREIATSVIDNGAGMDPETQARAFDQFYRAPAARKLAPDGSGVGLYTVRGLVEAMGGSVSIEASSLGGGTTVTVRLPAEPSELPE